jgi:hypothetical protein
LKVRDHYLGVRALGLAAAGLAACTQIVVVSPYDATTDQGLLAFKEKLNLVVMDAGSKKPPEGSFEAYKPAYAELEVKLALLRQRVALLEAEDTKCDVSPKLKALVGKLPRGAEVLAKLEGTAPPPVDEKSPVPVSPLAIGKQKDLPAAVGCMTHLIDNIAGQLTDIERMHADPAFCAMDNPPTLTCIRAPAAVGMLEAANRSLDAALLVQIHKKETEQAP